MNLVMCSYALWCGIDRELQITLTNRIKQDTGQEKTNKKGREWESKK